MASGILAEPYVIACVTGASGEVLYDAVRTALEISSSDLRTTDFRDALFVGST